MRVFCMRVRGVVMIMVVMSITVVMVMVSVIVIVVVLCLEAAHACAKCVAKRTIRYVRSGRRGALAFDVMMVAFLNRANFALKTEDLGPVFAQHAGRRRCVRERRVAFTVFGLDRQSLALVHRQDLRAVGAGAAVGRRVFTSLLDDAFREGFQHFGMVPKVS